jgi:hypothetical protein
LVAKIIIPRAAFFFTDNMAHPATIAAKKSAPTV